MRIVAAVAAGLLLSACTTFTRLRLQAQLARADREFEAEQFDLAAPHYENLIDRYPTDPERARIVFRTGIAYYSLKDYHNAERLFRAYLDKFPHGPYAADAETYLHKIAVELSPAEPARREAIEQARNDLNRLQQLRVQHPSDPEVCYALANLYYEIGDYAEAARYYYMAQQIDAVYREKALLRERLVVGPDGTPRALTPEEVRRIERDRNPLVVFGTHTYQARSDYEVLSAARYYNVSGYIRNQGSKLVENVEIEVRFVNAANQIQDVKIVRIGTLLPGEVRAFRAEASRFDNLYNIVGFEAIPRAGR